mmetsp:Transcript_41063/g.53856  ORF Transcript_41063/g.53856 Transcript_41063/m.53856 type:complete len:244 (+) Transcript_41063:567-1298(+)
MNAASDYNLLVGVGANGRRLQPPKSGGGGGGGAEVLGTAVGIALSGGYIYNALAAGNTDAVENEADTLDTCMSHPAPGGQFHYHIWSACAVKNYGYWSSTHAPPLCKSTTNCTTAPWTMNKAAGTNNGVAQQSYFTAANWDKPIGLARDGHLIMGPYKNASGALWTCADRDVCNGAFVSGQYVYVGADNFPYVTGCWGPGPTPEYKPGCTNNGCGSKASTAGALSFSLAGLSAVAAAATLALF